MPHRKNAWELVLSRTHISVNNGAIDKLVAKVNDNIPVVHSHTILERGESVVAEKGHGDQSEIFDFQVKEKPK